MARPIELRRRTVALGILGIKGSWNLIRSFGNGKPHIILVTQLPIRQMASGGFGPFWCPGRVLDRTMAQSYIVARYSARPAADQDWRCARRWPWTKKLLANWRAWPGLRLPADELDEVTNRFGSLMEELDRLKVLDLANIQPVTIFPEDGQA